MNRSLIISTGDLFRSNNVRKVKYLKIDTEGYDLDKIYYPDKIFFESNEHTPVDNILEMSYVLGYKLVSRGYDTTIILS